MAERIQAMDILARIQKKDETREHWLRLAAVWLWFDASELCDASGATFPMELFESELVPVRNAPGSRRLHTLRPETRHRTLRQLEAKPGGIEESIQQNAQELSRPENRLLVNALRGRAPDPDEVSLDLLPVYRDVAVLLEGLRAPVDLHRIERRLARERFVASLRELTEHFVGRERELRELRSYVDALDSQSIFEGVQRSLTRAKSALDQFVWGASRGALVVHGIGGVGKSTLISKFLLEHVESPDDALIYVYLDHERDDLSAGQPRALMLAAVDQLTARHPDHPQEFQEVDQWIDSKAAPRVFGGALRKLARGRPVLMVLDSFEVFQRTGNLTDRLSRFLTRVQSRRLRLRVVISGRTPAPDVRIGGVPPRPMRLEGLDPEAAALLLARMGVDRSQASAAVRHVGTNPLTLRLTGRLLQQDPHADLTSGSFWSRADDVQLQGLLYSRLLARIRDPRLRGLAAPGLAVRRIDEGVLTQVLDEPCSLGLEGNSTATQALLDSLRAEASLVSIDDDGALRYRTDLRQATYPLIQRKLASKVDEIHEAAVRYYGDATEGVRARERQYHLLMLGRVTEAAKIDIDDPSLPEDDNLLPPKSRSWWADRAVRLRPDEHAKVVGELFAQGDFEGVTLIWEQEPEVGRAAPLPVAQSLFWQGRVDQARIVARAAVDASVTGAEREYLIGLLGPDLPIEEA